MQCRDDSCPTVMMHFTMGPIPTRKSSDLIGWTMCIWMMNQFHLLIVIRSKSYDVNIYIFPHPDEHFWIKWTVTLFRFFSSSVVADKNFEDEDSVDGGRSSSSSSSKAPPSGRKTVMSSVRRPSSANAPKAPGCDANSSVYFLLSPLVTVNFLLL